MYTSPVAVADGTHSTAADLACSRSPPITYSAGIASIRHTTELSRKDRVNRSCLEAETAGAAQGVCNEFSLEKAGSLFQKLFIVIFFFKTRSQPFNM